MTLQSTVCQSFYFYAAPNFFFKGFGFFSVEKNDCLKQAM